MAVQIRRAERRQAKISLALTGPTGSGKTLSALFIARGLCGDGSARICLIDTENKSASLYADAAEKGIDFPFDVIEIDPPYTLEKHVEAIETVLATTPPYQVLIIDSISHIWAGEGGFLEQKDELDNANPKSNSWANWREVTGRFEEFRAWLLKADIHRIVTMRSKMAYEQTEVDGRKKIVKLGLQPIQRDGLEYEFTTVLDLTATHYADISKDRTGLFDSKPFQPSVETGRRLLTWLAGATGGPAAAGPKTFSAHKSASPSAPQQGQWTPATQEEIRTFDGYENQHLPKGVRRFGTNGKSVLQVWVSASGQRAPRPEDWPRPATLPTDTTAAPTAAPTGGPQ